MKRINANSIGISQGSTMLFSDFVNDGPMWAGQGDREMRRTIVFPESFSQPPSVHVAIGLYDIDHKHNIRADVSADTITAEKFDIVFRTWGDTRIARVRVDWMAIGAVTSDEDWQLY